jgi:hypothetical protein
MWSAKAKESREIAEKKRAQHLATNGNINISDDRADDKNDFIIRVEEAPGDGGLKASLVTSGNDERGREEGGEGGGVVDNTHLHPSAASSRNSSPTGLWL